MHIGQVDPFWQQPSHSLGDETALVHQTSQLSPTLWINKIRIFSWRRVEWHSTITPSVIPQDSSPPSVVRKRFLPAGLAACGCQARRKQGASRRRRRGIRHLRSYLLLWYEGVVIIPR